jgi:hypothetical protein
MTGDLAWLRELGVPVSNMAERIGRTPRAIEYELDHQQPETWQIEPGED